MLSFSERITMVRRFCDFVKETNENNLFKISDEDPLTFLAWLQSEGALDESTCYTLVHLYRIKYEKEDMSKHFSEEKDCT